MLQNTKSQDTGIYAYLYWQNDYIHKACCYLRNCLWKFSICLWKEQATTKMVHKHSYDNISDGGNIDNAWGGGILGY